MARANTLILNFGLALRSGDAIAAVLAEDGGLAEDRGGYRVTDHSDLRGKSRFVTTLSSEVGPKPSK